MVRLGIESEIIEDIDLVIFDKDGTLMDLYRYWSSMVGFRVDIAQERLGFTDEQRKDIMYAMGVDQDKGRLRRDGPVGLKKREIVMQAMIDALADMGFPYTRDLCMECFSRADEISMDCLPDIIKPVKGLNRLIKGLNKKACRIAVATTDKSKRAEIAMKELGIMESVHVVIGADMVRHSKPAPEMIEMILDRTGIRGEHAVVVGDAISDIEMGINAGLTASIGVCSGLTERDDLLQKTRYVVDDISEIKVI